MPEFFLELFSEEIPARMQADAAAELVAVTAPLFAGLQADTATIETFHGPRRLAIRAELAPEKPGGVLEARGPRISAPDAALQGFLGKHQAAREEIRAEDGYHVLRRDRQPVPALQLIAAELPAALAKFRWPKSMRWGQSGEFSWIRPLRRMICLFGGRIVPIRLGPVTAGDETQGHRILSPGAIAVSSGETWEAGLRAASVLVRAEDRLAAIVEGLREKASGLGLDVVEDDVLLREVCGLVEFPVPLIGEIDGEFMSLPPEVRELSMKANQRYFALRDAAGAPAPYFGFVSNMRAADGGAAIVAGNARVLRARLADARYFWQRDLETPLDALLPKLDGVIFHAKIGTQGERATRIAALARKLYDRLGLWEEIDQVEWAGRLCKADLVSHMVGEFPELQGVMGGYYAERNPHGWDGPVVGQAIRTHYQPKGPKDAVPTGAVAICVALADKLDTLAEFFRAGEKPTGSGDPYALRRAALGVVRIILENHLTLRLKLFLGGGVEVFDFIIERLRVKLRGEGRRFDILDAVLAGGGSDHDDLLRIMRRIEAMAGFLATADGANLLAGYRRAASILRIENAKDGPHLAYTLSPRLPSPEGRDIVDVLDRGVDISQADYAGGNYAGIMEALAGLRAPIDAFFDKVTINDADPDLRRKHLQVLAKLRDTMHLVADFSKIEG